MAVKTEAYTIKTGAILLTVIFFAGGAQDPGDDLIVSREPSPASLQKADRSPVAIAGPLKGIFAGINEAGELLNSKDQIVWRRQETGARASSANSLNF